MVTCPSAETNIGSFKEQKEFLLSLTEDKPTMSLPNAKESCDKGGCGLGVYFPANVHG